MLLIRLVAIVLFIFGVTSSSSAGWGSAMALTPLLVGITMVVGFFYWETKLPVEIAAV